MFPYMSSYYHLLGLGGRDRGQQRTPWDDIPGTDDDADYGPATATDPWMSAPRPPGSGDDGPVHPNRRAGLGAGLTALGANLLEAAPRNDWGGGVGRGAAAFSEAYGAGQERSRRDALAAGEERRRQAQDARAEEQERDRNRQDDLSFEQGNAELAAWRQEQGRGKEARARTGKSAEQMTAEIQALAAQNPNDAKLQVMARRAAGYALGEDSDLNKLADLHEQMTGQAFRGEDAAWKTRTDIEGRRQAINAGVESDPAAAERRANRQLEISEGHLGVARDQAATEKNRVTDLQAYDRIEKRVQAKIEQRVKSYRDENLGRSPDPGTLEAWRQEALREAMGEFKSMMDSAYDYTANGQLIPRR